MSRLYGRSKNYDMALSLDYNIELFPLLKDESFALALATSLAREGRGAGAAAGEDADDKDKDVWRPDGKGRRGLEEDYDYVMFGKVRCDVAWVATKRSHRLPPTLLPCAFTHTNSFAALSCELVQRCISSMVDRPRLCARHLFPLLTGRDNSTLWSFTGLHMPRLAACSWR